MKKVKHTVLFFLIINAFGFLSAQEGKRISEDAVQLQRIFIEGLREKILGNYKEAAVLFEALLEKDKTNHAAAFELARTYDVLDENEKAIKFAKMATDLEKDNAWYQLFLANLYKKVNRDKEAAGVYEFLVQSEPDNEYYYFKWAYFLVRANRTQEAIEVYDDLENRKGIHEEIIRRKHSLYLGLGNYKKAAKELEKLINAFPKKTEYRHLLANFYQQIGEKEKAKAVFKEILERNPDDTRAALALVEGSKKKGSEFQYLDSLKPIFSNPDVNIDVKISKIISGVEEVRTTGDKKLAAALLELTSILEEVHQNDAKAFAVSGDVLYNSGQLEQALGKYKKTLELDESVYLVWENLLFIYSELRDYDNLVKNSKEALDLFPNQATLYYLDGLGYSHKEKHRESIGSLQQALFMAGKNNWLKFNIYSLLGTEYFSLKQYKQSENAFEEALKLNPSDALVLNNYSRYLTLRGKHLDKAKQMSGLSNELAPNTANFQDTYGWVLYKMGEYKAAKEWIGKALESSGKNDPTILEHFGDVLFQLKQETTAVIYWQEALEKGAKSELLQKKIVQRKLFE